VQQQLTQISAAEAATMLAWMVGAGADALVDEAPRNWLAAPIPVASPPPLIQSAPQRAAISGATPAIIANPATAIAAGAADLAALEAAVAGFEHPLRRAGIAPLLLTGNISAGIIILSDQPETDGSPTARLITRMLAAVGIDDSDCARAHLLPWATPGGRAPKDEELAAFAPFRARAFELAAPRLVLAFGDRAAALSGQSRGIASARGKWLAVGNTPLLATFHPRILLAQPELKRLAWADLQAFAARIETSR
jgi:uracil-DNA glycosylase family 4